MGTVSSKGFLNGQPFPADLHNYRLNHLVSLGTFLNQGEKLGNVKYTKVLYSNLNISSLIKVKQAERHQNDGKLDEGDDISVKTAKEESGSIEGECDVSCRFRGAQRKKIITPDDGENIKNELEVKCEPCEVLNRNMYKFHVVIVIQTNAGEFWSIEKCDKSIIVQRSKNLSDILKFVSGKCRSEELKYDIDIERQIKREYKEDDCTNLPRMHDVLLFVSSTETQLGYHSLSQLFNCQGFLQRIVGYIYENDVRLNCDLLNRLHWTIKLDIFLSLMMKYYANVFKRPKQVYKELKEKATEFEMDKGTMLR